MYTDNLAYAKQRLEGTIVRIGEEPFYVQRVAIGDKIHDVDPEEGDDDDTEEGEVVCEGIFLKNSASKVVEVTKLNLCPIPLGYVNLRLDAAYFVRKPMRNDWRQGLRENNLTCIGTDYYGVPDFENLRDTVLNNYPTLSVCQDLLKLGYVTRAFSRDFAISDKNLYYRGKICGEGLELHSKYTYLKEYLKETIDANR